MSIFVRDEGAGRESGAEAAERYIDLMSGVEAPSEFAPLDTSSRRNTRSHVEGVSAQELIQLGAADSEFFCRTFFPKAFRQTSPSFAPAFWQTVESDSRLINIQMFRGASKTTRCRALTLKLMAYGLAHTILFVSKSERDALRSGGWIKQQILYNRPFAELFRLRQGGKWTDEEFEIIHGIDEYPIWVICAGITGSIRGINRDDFRPDLIVLDDIHDRENSATPEQRLKIQELVFGALLESLAPESEAPHAKMINLATPLNKADITSEALKKGTGWLSLQVPCWTLETWNNPTHLQESVWPERWASETLRKEKEEAAARNMLSTWLREKELRITAPETAAFRIEWLGRYSIAPEGMFILLVIDPVPPPSQHAIEKGLHKNDFEAMGVIGVLAGRFYVLDLVANRGHDPSWTTAEFFRLARKWAPKRVLVEAVAYQRTLAWILREEMRRRAVYFAIEEVQDRRSKYDRIVDGLNGPASQGALLIPENLEDKFDKDAWNMFLEQFERYPDVNHDDVLEVVAVGVSAAAGRFDGEEGEFNLEREMKQYPRLVYERAAP